MTGVSIRKVFTMFVQIKQYSFSFLLKGFNSHYKQCGEHRECGGEHIT